MRLRAGVASDRGLVRQNNEDSYLVRRGLYAVCDGMGGARAGEVASEMACRGLLALDTAQATADELREAIIKVDRAIVDRSLGEEGLLGMGTTLTAALAGEGSLTLAHVGDSRAYLLRKGDLIQLTDDHSWVGEMVRRGELTPAQAAVHPHRSVITRVLGTGGELEPDMIEVAVEAGDRVMICSDGLTGMVSDQELAGILQQDADPQTVAELLVQAALSGGGEDNVTVVVVDVMPSSLAPGSPPGDGETDEGGETTGGGETPGKGDEAGDEGAPPGEDETPQDGGDEILLGPSDRGIVSAATAGRGGRAGAGMRGRLGGRIGPFLSPSIRRPVGGATAAGQAGGTVSSLEATTQVEPAEAGSRRWTRRRWAILAVTIVVVVAVLVGGFAVYNSTVYYIGTFAGTVALFQGLPASILGIDLSSVIEMGAAARDSLAPHLQARVDAHDLISKEEGQLFLRTLSAQ